MEATDTPGKTVRVAIVLLPEYSQMVHMLLSELLRIAGLAGAVKFETVACSPAGRPVSASNGRMAEIDSTLTDISRANAAIVCASYNPYDHLDRAVIAWLRLLERRAALIGGVDTGAIMLAEGGLLEGRRATLHWDELDLAREKYPGVQFTGTLVERSPGRLTGCGSLGTIEFASELIAAFAGHEVADGVMSLTIHGRHETRFEHANPKLAKAIRAMSENIEAPLPIDAVAQFANISTWQLARIFDIEFGIGPGRYYLDLRLDRARELITKTRFPLTEIAYSAGFNSASWFSRAFKAKFSMSPTEARHGKRLPQQTH